MIKLVKSRGEVRGDRYTSENIYLLLGRTSILENIWQIFDYLQQFLCRYTTVGTLHATSLQGFDYGDVVHQFEKRCI